MPENCLLPLNAISAADLPLVGGKGANLGEMVRLGLPVPEGFCLTTQAFETFMQSTGSRERIYQSLDAITGGDVEAVRRVGKNLRQQLRTAPLPAQIETQLVAAWRHAGDEHAYAVRSSATAEDLPNASFAGQQDTFLNVIGREALLDAVRDCWISLFTDRAILYRLQNGFDHRQVLLSVVVQRMIEPEVSGILFTADPVNGHRHVASIDASFGLGEALVAGLVSADLYRVDKRSLQLIETRIGDKRVAIRPKPGGATVKVELPADMRNAQVLDPDQVSELVELGTLVEAHYGFPQDIEWVWSQGKFYLVQTRPITSLFPLPEPSPPDDNLRVYFSLSHVQVMTDAFSPMGISIIRSLLPFGSADKDTGYYHLLCHAGGRLYGDLSPLIYHPLPRRILPRALTMVEELSALALMEVVARPEFLNAAGRGGDKVSMIAIFRTFVPIAFQTLRQVLFGRPEEAVGRVLEHNLHSLQKIENGLFHPADVLPRMQNMRQIINGMFLGHAIVMLPYIAAGMMSRVLLEKLVGSRGYDEHLQALYRGLQGNVTTEMDLQVGDLADIARQHPAVRDRLLSMPPARSLPSLEAVPGGGEFLEAFNLFLAKYGMRGPSEIDIARPRWLEDPSPLLQVVVGSLSMDESGTHRRHHGELVEAGEAAIQHLAEAARYGIFGPLRAAMVRRLGRVTRGMFAIREHPKYLIVRAMWLVKTIIKESAKVLVDRGKIEQEQDVWMLQLHELVAAFEPGAGPLKGLIAQRKQEYNHFQGLIPPRVITSDGEIVTARFSLENLPEGALAGSPVSAGVVEGIARVVLDPAAQVLQPGEILVAPFTDPGWTPLFINAAGLVMEVGGLMTHGSVVAREYGLPAVVGVPDATRIIQSGQRIRVNGDAGFVELIDAPAGNQAGRT